MTSKFEKLGGRIAKLPDNHAGKWLPDRELDCRRGAGVGGEISKSSRSMIRHRLDEKK
jgi:hypothetical protein